MRMPRIIHPSTITIWRYMKPDQNRQMHNRSTSNRRGSQSQNQFFQSTGPNVKIRGTARQVAEQYLQLARDAHTGNDPVAAENYLQHAEHYFRLVRSAEEAQVRAQNGDKRVSGDFDPEEMNDENDVDALPDRFSSSAERAPQRVDPEANFAPPTPPRLPGPSRPPVQRRA
jgi:hypothetical protein